MPVGIGYGPWGALSPTGFQQQGLMHSPMPQGAMAPVGGGLASLPRAFQPTAPANPAPAPQAPQSSSVQRLAEVLAGGGADGGNPWDAAPETGEWQGGIGSFLKTTLPIAAGVATGGLGLIPQLIGATGTQAPTWGNMAATMRGKAGTNADPGRVSGTKSVGVARDIGTRDESDRGYGKSGVASGGRDTGMGRASAEKEVGRSGGSKK
ncbi:MAG: hypothetical protein AB7I33_12020 [Gemmatimonadales bacterium]